MQNLISIREIADNKTCISSTRWAFAATIKFDVFIIAVSVFAGLLSHFLPGVEDLEASFYGSVAMLLGILTGITGTAKALQGFEPYAGSNTNCTEECTINN